MAESEGLIANVESGNIYGSFIEDMKAQGLRLSPDSEIREKLLGVRDPSLPDEERKMLRNEIIESQLRLIPYVIKLNPDRGIPPEELVGISYQIIDRCIENWSPDYVSPKTEEQVKFSTYVSASLQAHLRSPRGVVEIGKPIDVPAYIMDLENYMKKARELFYQEKHREPSVEEWYKRTVQYVGESGRNLSALESTSEEAFNNTYVARLGGMTRIGKEVGSGRVDSESLSPSLGRIEETLVDTDESVEMQVERRFVSDDLDNAMTHLNSRERRVLQLYFGLGLNEDGDPIEPMTYEEIASIFDISTSRVGQIKDRALRKMRHPTVMQKIDGNFDGGSDSNADLIQESGYKSMISRVVYELMFSNDKSSLTLLLKEMRQGSFENGRFDPRLLSQYFRPDEVDRLIEYEEKFAVSPRRLTSDLLQMIQNYVQGFHENDPEYCGRVRNSEIRSIQYWKNVGAILPDDLKMTDEEKSAAAKQMQVLREKRKTEVGHQDSGDFISAGYNEAVSYMASSIIKHGSLEAFKDIFARGLYVQGQQGKVIHPNAFGIFSYEIENIEESLKGASRSIMNIGQDVAREMEMQLQEMPEGKKNRTWRDVSSVSFTNGDFEKWIESH